MKIKKRLDNYLIEKYPQYSKTLIQSFIMQGRVKIDGQVITKPGTAVKEDSVRGEPQIEVNFEVPKYVCRAGWKLEKALEHFNIDTTGLVILDAGLSTGGFTDCLLQKGAKKVYGVDVGFGQVHEKISQDPRVVVMEKTNLRYLNNLPEKVDLVTLDLSFISILKVMNTVCSVLKNNGLLVTLIKPQFEAERHEIERGGIITDPKVHNRVVDQIKTEIGKYGFECVGIIESPILGTEGNKEFLAYFKRNSK